MTELHIPPIKTAVEIAALVKCIPIEQGAALIEQYAATIAAQARLDQTSELHNRLASRPIDGSLSKDHPDLYD